MNHLETIQIAFIAAGITVLFIIHELFMLYSLKYTHVIIHVEETPGTQ